MEFACFPLCDTVESDVGRIDLYDNIVIGDISQEIRGQAAYSMVMVIFVVFIFVFGSVLVSQDAHDLVVRPIERMTAVIRKLAGTICILSAGEDEDLDDAEDGIDETILLESVVTKMAGIFNISGSSNSTNKALGMLTGEKHTEFKTKSSVYSIHVVEEAHFERHSDNNVRLGAINEAAAASPEHLRARVSFFPAAKGGQRREPSGAETHASNSYRTCVRANCPRSTRTRLLGSRWSRRAVGFAC